MSSFLSKNKLPLIAGILMLLIIPIAITISGQTTNLQPRAAVEKTEQSKLSLSAITSASIGQEFFIDIHLDTTKDPKFVISGVDAIITYDPKFLEISSFNLGSALDTITQQNIDATQGKITVSLSNNAVQDQSGNPVGYSGEAAIISLKAKALRAGKTSLKYVYEKGASTSDTNVIGFLKDKPIEGQTPRERLLSKPPELNLTITQQQANKISWSTPYAVLEADNFYITAGGKKFTSSGAKVDIHSDAPDGNTTDYMTLEASWQENGQEMRLYIYFRKDSSKWWAFEVRGYDGPELGKWVYYHDANNPGTEIYTHTLGKPVIASISHLTPTGESQNLSANNYNIHFENLRLQPFLSRVSPTPTPSSKPEATCIEAGGTWKEFNNGCVDSCASQQPGEPVACTQALKFGCDCGPTQCWSGQTCTPTRPTPRASCVPRPACLDANPACLLAPADPGTVFCPPSSPRPTASPTPTPKPTISLQIQLDMPGRDNKTVTGTLYGLETSQVQGVTIAQGFESIGGPAPTEVQRDRSTGPVQTLTTFTTNTSGMANVEIPAKFQGKSMRLFVRTQSHLVRKTTSPVTLSNNTGVSCLPEGPCPLRPIAIQQVSFANLIPGDIYIAPNQTEQDNVINTFDTIELRTKHLGKDGPNEKADFNGDGTVNARDYRILLDNLNKKGDDFGTKITPVASLPPIACAQVYEPVCCSGRTYSNQCEAGVAGAKLCKPGTCKTLGSPIPLNNPPSRTTCPDVFNPVCASDGQTYNNECLATAKGLYWTRGACNSAQ